MQQVSLRAADAGSWPMVSRIPLIQSNQLRIEKWVGRRGGSLRIVGRFGG
jgi:hypothetical protein